MLKSIQIDLKSYFKKEIEIRARKFMKIKKKGTTIRKCEKVETLNIEGKNFKIPKI